MPKLKEVFLEYFCDSPLVQNALAYFHLQHLLLRAIPNDLHFIWLGSGLKNKHKENILTFLKHNPDYKVHLWVDSATIWLETVRADMQDIKSFCTSNNIILHDISIMTEFASVVTAPWYNDWVNGEDKVYAFAADFLRLEILYRYGGIYSDIDAVCLFSLGALGNETGVFVWGTKKRAQAKFSDNCFIAAAPKNKMFLKSLQEIRLYYQKLMIACIDYKKFPRDATASEFNQTEQASNARADEIYNSLRFTDSANDNNKARYFGAYPGLTVIYSEIMQQKGEDGIKQSIFEHDVQVKHLRDSSWKTPGGISRKKGVIFGQFVANSLNKSTAQLRLMSILTLLISFPCFATNYNYPAGPLVPPVPLTLSTYDSLVVSSSTMQSTGASAYTVGNAGMELHWDSILDINVQAGATVSYAGSDTSASTFFLNYFNLNGGNYGYNFTIEGTVNKGTGTYAINLGSLGEDTAQATIGLTGSVVGAMNLVENTILNINGSGSVNGAISNGSTLNLGASSAVNFSTQGAISDMLNINIIQGTFTVNNLISGVNNSFNIASGATATLGANGSIAGSGTFTNAGKFNIASAFNPGAYGSFVNTTGELYVIGSGRITGNVSAGTILRIGQDSTGAANSCNFTTGGTISGIEVVSVNNGSLTANHAISGVNTSFDVANGTTATFNTQLSGTGTDVTNAGNLILTVANAINTSGGSNPFVNSATGNVYAAHTFTPSSYSTFTNSGAFFVYGSAGAISGAFSPSASAGSLNYGRDKNGTLYNNTYSTGGAITNTPTMRIYAGTFNVNHSIIGLNSSFTVDSDAILNINNTFSGSGSFVNNGTTVFGNASTSIASFSSFTNNSTLNVTANSASSVNITNDGAMTIAANLSMPGRTLNGSGTVTVSGQRTLTAANYTNTGTHVSTISDSSTYDKLTCTGCAVNIDTLDLSSSSISGNITTPITILSGTTVSISNIIAPIANSGIFAQFDVDIDTAVSPQIVTVTSSVGGFERLADPGTNKELGEILDGFANSTNLSAEQSALLNALAASPDVNTYNKNLQELYPNTNTIIPNVAVQDAALEKVGQRVANLRDGYSYAHSGISAGELSPYRSLWMTNFGSITQQQTTNSQIGYKAKSLGLLFGLDQTIRKNVIGVAWGLSGTHLKEAVDQSHTTDIDRVHGVFYGTHSMPYQNFLDWMLTGSFNNNRINRPSTINGVSYANRSKFKSYNVAVKLIRGKSCDFLDSYRITPLTLLQYDFIRQHSYTESGSFTSTNVAGQSKNILTLGAGARLNFPIDAWDAIGMRELRAIVTYDVLNNKDNTIVNFVVGGGSFTVVNTPPRLALRLGAGMTFEMTKHLQLLLNYDYEVRSRYTDHTGMLKVKYVF